MTDSPDAATVVAAGIRLVESMSVQDELAASISEILEPNLQFYRQNPADTNRYFVDPLVLTTLGWIGTSIGLPILLSGVNEVVKEKVKQWLATRKEKRDPTIQPPDDVLRELGKVLESKGGLVIQKEDIQPAIDEVSEFLSFRGWPTPFAKADAQEIIEIIRTKVEKTRKP
jgi:hypothetical protein